MAPSSAMASRSARHSTGRGPEVQLHEKIPNNVELAGDRKLVRALEQWQPSFLEWWRQMGPESFQAADVYLRTAVSVDSSGWAHFDYVKMPEYRWGIFLASSEADRTIGFGDQMGQPVWGEVPGEYRNLLRRLIVTQADTEPASVEQQRRLGKTAPSLYDLRNLFQVNVEEGRHLWAMVYLLHRYFGRDGREEAEALLARRSGDPDRPRILGAFNAPIDDSVSLDLFGGEISSNAAEYFACGLKGRANEKKYDDHLALQGSYRMSVPENGRLEERDVPLRNAMNEVLRDSYIDDNQRGLDVWNKTIAEHGIDLRLRLPSRRFNRL